MADDAKWEYAICKTLFHEGGYANDPRDPGGETNFGISTRSYPALDIAALTREEAVEIYRRDWWDKYGYGRIADKLLAAKVFDLAVNAGPKRACKLLQKAINKTCSTSLEVDGQLGPVTIAAANHCHRQAALLAQLKVKAIDFYHSLGRPEFEKGWIRRVLD